MRELKYAWFPGSLAVALLIVALILVIAGVKDITGLPVLGTGDFAVGYLGAGNFSLGIFSAGIFAVGVFSIGIFSVGIFSIGIFNIGIFSVGIYAIGVYTARRFIAPEEEVKAKQ